MAGLSGADAVREALEHIEAAVHGAARRRARLVRELATVAPPPELSGDHRELVEALLRRESADASTSASPHERAATVLDESRRVHDARDRIAASATDDAGRAYLHTIDLLRRELDASWRWALEQADAASAHLVGRTSTEVADAVAAYVAAFRGMVQAGETLDAEAVTAAVEEVEAASARLEAALSA